MKKKYHKTRNILSILILLPLLVVATACENSSIPLSEDFEVGKTDLTVFSNGLENSKINGKVAAQLAEVRRATAHFHDHEIAEAAGYLSTEECVEIPGVGGMGYHFVNPGLIGPPEELDITKPQVLLYEPQKNGKLRFIGVEFVVPGTILNSEGPAPMLFDEQLHWNPFLEHWDLHVWLWRNNPSGMFEDWNPKVNCDYAPEPVEE